MNEKIEALRALMSARGPDVKLEEIAEVTGLSLESVHDVVADLLLEGDDGEA